LIVLAAGEDVDLASDATTLKIARRTTAVINEINDYSPTNGLCMAWPPSARVVNSTTMLLGKFDQALQDTMMPNFIPYGHIQITPSIGPISAFLTHALTGVDTSTTARQVGAAATSRIVERPLPSTT